MISSILFVARVSQCYQVGSLRYVTATGIDTGAHVRWINTSINIWAVSYYTAYRVVYFDRQSCDEG